MKVLITRPRVQSGPFAEALMAAGFETAFLPVIEIQRVDDLGELDRAIREIFTYDWIVFTSINGVEIFFDHVDDWRDLTRTRRPKVAAIGSKTAEALRLHGAAADFVPDEYVAEAILPGLGDLPGKRVLLPGAEIGRDVLPRAIVAAGGRAHEISVYRTLPAEADPAGLAALRSGVDIVTFTSPSTVDNFVSLAEQHGLDPHDLPGGPRFACIGPVTEEEAREQGFTRLIVAEDHTTEGMVEALRKYAASLEVS